MAENDEQNENVEENVDELTPDGTAIAHFGGLNQPQRLGVDAQGNVYVADAGNARVVRFGPTGTFIDAWGAYGHGDGEFVAPADVVIGSSGDAYVSDTFNNRLERFSLGLSTPPPTPAPPAPAPKRRLAAPRLTLRIARRQRVLRQGGVKVMVNCVSNCRTVVTAKGLRTLTLTLHAKHVAHRKLALTKATKKRIKTALSRHRRSERRVHELQDADRGAFEDRPPVSGVAPQECAVTRPPCQNIPAAR